MTGSQLDNVVKLLPSFGIYEITPRLCEGSTSKIEEGLIEFFCEAIVAGSFVVLETVQNIVNLFNIYFSF